MKRTTSIAIIVGVAAVLIVGLFLFGRDTSPAPTRDISDTEQSEQRAEVRIVAFGDSLTAGFGLPLAESYPAILERTLHELGHSVEVVNAGVSGETTAGARERAQFIRDRQNADIVLLGIGGNDALRSLPVSEARANITHILTTLTSGEDAPQVLLLQIQAPQNAGVAYKEAFDALYPDLAREFDIPLVPFVVLEVVRDSAFMLPDGIHPNSAGYEFLVHEYIAPAVEALLPEGDSI